VTLPSKPCCFLRQRLTAESHGDLSENWKLCVQSHVPVGLGRVPAGESLGEGYQRRGERGHGLQEQFSPEDGPSGVIGFPEVAGQSTMAGCFAGPGEHPRRQTWPSSIGLRMFGQIGDSVDAGCFCLQVS
jgi:hypothetical protein